MQNDHPTVPSVQTREAPQAAAAHAVKRRERIRQAQIVAAQAARARAAGEPPRGGEVARLVAEFHARGGQVTVCPPADSLENKAE